MRPASYLPRAPALVLPALVSMPFFASPVLAQDDNSDTSKPAPGKTSSDAKAQPKQTAQESSQASKPTAAASQESKSTPSATPSSPSSDSKQSSTSSESSSSATKAPASKPSAQPSGDDNFSFLPTLSNGIPSYPAPTVPPTRDAPFMQQSSLPDGTVFIAVGAILGAFGLAILLWRVIVSFLLHRSVERAAKAQHSTNNKAAFPPPPAPFYKYTDHSSSMSVGATAGRGVRRTNRSQVPSTNLSQSNLFFSPTAAASNQGNARGSAFLPSGFYAAGSGTASPGAHHGQSYSLTNLRPESRGHYASASRNTLNMSPPDSPQTGPRRDLSTSSLNLSAAPSPGQRAPSAYLDDLLADDPGALPPRNMTPRQR